MSTVQKVNNDSESKRMQKNMTQTQKKNTGNIKEGKIVNFFVKDNLLSLDETMDTLLISKSDVGLPNKLYEKDKKKKSSFLYLNLISALIMSTIAGFTYLIKRSSKKHLESTQEYLLPGITRNHCINNEIHQSIFSLVQSPNRKTILAAIGVISLATTAFISKIFIDGCRDVWVKKREADIQKNLQESLIEVETQSFAGKIQIIRSMLSSKAKFLVNNISEQQEVINFKQVHEKKDNNNKLKNILPQLVFCVMTLAGIVGLGYFSLHNIRSSEQFAKKSLNNTKKALDNLIKDFNSNKKIADIKDHNDNVLKGTSAYKFVMENLLESMYAKPAEIEEYVSRMNLSSKEKKEFVKHLNSAMNQSTEKVNSAMGGSGRNKITYFSHVNDYLSFFYDWLMNPKNPQFKNLFIGITGVSAIGYIGKTVAEAIKDIEVKKYNAKTELDLQKRLVATELKNFKAKKESVIEPLCQDFLVQKANGKSPKELKVMADNILFEIKNGPPFVYS